jgi:lysophospholipid acyltransferase (LPLAT)-like uncharacterized protein
MRAFKRLVASPGFQRAVGTAAAEYLRFVRFTSRFELDPPDIYDQVIPQVPVIVTMWHGQHFITPFVRPPGYEAKVLISRHRDGEINAIAAERLGVGTIRGSGAHGGDFHRKGGISAFKEMVQALQQGCNVALTADVPKVARVAGEGVVRLARESGRPIYPVAMATSRYIELDNWDRSAINLPFSRMIAAIGEPIRVPQDANAATIEQCRKAVEAGLNEATKRAYAIARGEQP